MPYRSYEPDADRRLAEPRGPSVPLALRHEMNCESLLRAIQRDIAGEPSQAVAFWTREAVKTGRRLLVVRPEPVTVARHLARRGVA